MTCVACTRALRQHDSGPKARGTNRGPRRRDPASQWFAQILGPRVHSGWPTCLTQSKEASHFPEIIPQGAEDSEVRGTGWTAPPSTGTELPTVSAAVSTTSVLWTRECNKLEWLLCLVGTTIPALLGECGGGAVGGYAGHLDGDPFFGSHPNRCRCSEARPDLREPYAQRLRGFLDDGVGPQAGWAPLCCDSFLLSSHILFHRALLQCGRAVGGSGQQVILVWTSLMPNVFPHTHTTPPPTVFFLSPPPLTKKKK